MDPTLQSKPYGSCLIIGKSGSGKTTLVKSILKYHLSKKQSKVFTVNAKGHEYKKLSSDITNVSFEQLNSIPSKSIIIIEDIISLTELQCKTLRESINFNAHHKKQKIFVITHHVYKTKLYSLIAHFSYIIFTASSTNLPILKIVLQHSGFLKEEIVNWIEAFKNTTNPFSYFILNGENNTFFRCDSIKDFKALKFKSLSSSDIDTNVNSTTSKDDLIQRFDSFIEQSYKHKQTAKNIFSILINALPNLHNINLGDLTFICQTQSGIKMYISLVDYILSLLHKSIKPTKQLLFLHSYFKRLCTVPLAFIKNKRYY